MSEGKKNFQPRLLSFIVYSSDKKSEIPSTDDDLNTKTNKGKVSGKSWNAYRFLKSFLIDFFISYEMLIVTCIHECMFIV